MRFLLLAAMLLLGACTSIDATRPAPPVTGRIERPAPDAAEALDAVLRREGIVTAGIGVIRDGELVWSHYYGDQTPGQKADAATRFNVASITKLITAETALRLVAAGDLDLDAPLAPYWVDPDVVDDPRHQALTARMVLNHTSGLPNWRAFRADRRLAFDHDPGTHYGYSGEGFEWLARALETKLGMPFPTLVQRTVFDPIGMTTAAIAVDRENLDGIARPVDAEGRFPGHYCPPYGGCKADGAWSAADDLVVTVPDLARFLGAVHSAAGYDSTLALERDRVQTDRGEEQLVDCAANAESPCPIRQGYGLGFEVAHFAEGSTLGHGGSDWAEDTLAYLDQPSGDGLIILLNAPNPRGMRAMADLIALLDPDPPYLPRYRAWQAKVQPTNRQPSVSP